MKVRLLIALLATSIVIGYACLHRPPQPENATWRVEDDTHIRWEKLPVTWSFMCGSPDVPEFRDGFKWWNDRFGKVFQEIPQDTACLCDGGDCPQLQVLEGLEAEDISAVLTDGGVKSYARTFLARDGGFFTGGLVRYYDEFGDADDEARQTIARHEAGHVLGLMHSGQSNCMMYPTVEKDAIVIKPICPGEEKLFRAVYEVP